MADMQDMHASASVPRIAEVVYDAALGTWGYMHLRSDKTEPNYVDTVIGVFIEQAEAISVEELEYRMLLRPDAEDDFASQIARMKGQMLEYQRKKHQKSLLASTATATASSGASASSASNSGGGNK
jgi:hypothetical protein